ncbi:YicC/YloC family endoribonuclease [Inmirania thermothiophila]|uniref:Uncharacterized protein (TIGR00255 family) n=1 Tax=Inmirania thermothiophila TaxID=1750597 RepID=A0A3N1Y5P1_9GAMM|nr:YicC/YloC family endoribonuclease [Inmirania thermothiophila]ROR34136.1 uncharacterized protein (TIGR00255 family) [Inmirania thermothiophila]
MIRSMTAFARRAHQASWGSLCWELRTVNHRFLDIALRLPEDFRGLEPRVRRAVERELRRGKVEVSLRYQPECATAPTLALNRPLAEALVRELRAAAALLDEPAPVSPLELLRWPGVLEAGCPDLGPVQEAALKLLDEALADLVATREREGARLAELVRERCRRMAELAHEAAELQPRALEAQRERLRRRAAELAVELDPQRLEQELVMLAQKMDVSEELDRLAAHVAEVERVLAEGSPAGRRLDFLAQELNREANTLAAKSADTEVTRIAVELKVLIEQVREQIQNIE